MIRLWVIIGLFIIPFFAEAVDKDKLTGYQIMDEVFKRHSLCPYVLEEQTMISVDNSGNRDIREMRYFSRIEKDKTIKHLLVFDTPVEVRGTAILTIYDKTGKWKTGVYLPAYGKELRYISYGIEDDMIMGIDLNIWNQLGEEISKFSYNRITDRTIDKMTYYVIEAFPKNESMKQTNDCSRRTYFIRQDNFFIIRNDYFDHKGHFIKRVTFHDLKQIDGNLWQANMILVENRKYRQKLLILVNQRVFSPDYVRPEIFTANWLFDDRHIKCKGNSLFWNFSIPAKKKNETHANGFIKKDR